MSKLYLLVALILLSVSANAQEPVTSGILRIVITKDEIQRQNIRRLDQLFDGQIPGIIAVDRGTSQTTSMRSRGISSIGAAALPRIYLNEVPLDGAFSLAQIAVETVDSVVAEVGAAAGSLIGAGASGGVVRIYTKRGRVNTPLVVGGKISSGLDQSLYGEGNKLFQDHIAELEGGGKSFTYYTGAGYGSEGEWAPSYRDRVMHANGSLTGYSRYGSVTLHGRLNDRRHNVPDFRDTGGSFPAHRINDLVHSTYGVIANSAFTKWWRNEVFYGVHQSDEESVQSEPSLSAPGDTFLINLDYDASRTTFIYHTSVTLPAYGAITPRISASYDKSTLKATERLDLLFPSSIPAGFISVGVKREWEGIAAKLGLLVGKNLVLNAGIRRDTKDGGLDSKVDDPKIYPRYDAAYTFLNPWMKDSRFTLRAAYGEVANPNDDKSLKPEVLRGLETGFDMISGATQLGLTLFRQTGKEGQVFLFPVGDFNAVDVKTDGLSAYLNTNHGPWVFTANYTTYHSEVDKVASFVVGTFQPFDNFPAQNGHASIRYTDKMGTLSLDARYVGSHREEDATTLDPDVKYPGFVTYDLNMSKPLGSYGTFLFFVHNLANVERYGSSNADYVYGRRFGLGLRFTR